MGNELHEEEDWDTWKDDAETGEEPVLKKNSLDAATAVAAEDDVFGFPAQPPSVRASCSRIVKRGILSSPTPLPPPPPSSPRSFATRKQNVSCVGDVLLVGFAASACSARVQSRLQCFSFFGKIKVFWQKWENFNSF